jgi:hypothetical protein
MPERKYVVEDNTEAIDAIMARIAERGFTPLQEHFGAWVIDVSGQEFSTVKERNAAVLGAKIALALRMEHQKSPANHEFKAERREASAQEAAAKPKRAPKAAAEDTEDEAPARPARRGPGRPRKDAAEASAKPAGRPARKTAAAATPASEAKTPARRGRAAAAPAGRPARKNAKAEVDF